MPRISFSPGFGAKTLVTVKLSARRIAAGAPLPVRIANGNDFTVSGTLAGQGVEQGKTSKRRAAEIKAKSFKITAHAAKTVKLKLTPAMRQLLGRVRKLTLRLTPTAPAVSPGSPS